jgi:Flp pilus assembly protein TadG
MRPVVLERERAHGQAMVEFALALPAFMLLLFLLFEAGRLGATYISVKDAAREGARIASLGVPSPSTTAEIRQTVMNYLLPLSGPGIVNTGASNGASDIKIFCTTNGTDVDDCTGTGTMSAQTVRVEVTFTYAPLPILTTGLGSITANWGQMQMLASATTVVE